MTPEDCYAFDYCDSPLCPLDEDIKHRCWYSEDPICGRLFKREGEKTPLFVKNQRKIVTRIREENKDTYFVHKMLDRKFVIRAGIKGINPDSEVSEKAQLNRWLRTHTGRKELTDEEKKVVKERLKKYYFKKGVKASKR